MTADSYSPTKEQMTDVKMVNNENGTVVVEIEDRHFMFKCLNHPNAEKLTHSIAEFVATACLMFLTCMTCVEGLEIVALPLQTSIGCGLTVLVVLSIFGGISHCHINPAVTLSAALNRLISIPIAVIYVLCQSLGALVGVGILRLVTPKKSYFKGNSTVGLCMTVPNSEISLNQSLFVEFLITTILIWLVCAVWDVRNSRWQDSVAMKFGCTIVTISIAAGPFTGASMNPVRSLAPAFYAGNLNEQWIYAVGPLLGSIFGTLSYKYIFN